MNRDHPERSSVRLYLMALQETLCTTLQTLDTGLQCREDHWMREGGGGGRSRMLQDGRVLERAGANFSHVHGERLPAAATLQRPHLSGGHFEAMGVSLVTHPLNPYVPTAHLNVRFFIVTQPDGTLHWWFGGGFDLTPYYPFAEDVRHWHRVAMAACAGFGDSGEETYRNCKRQCDEYFFLPHRNEPRGVGGLFFDDLDAWGFQSCFRFVRSVGDHFLPAYLPIIERRMRTPWGQRERRFQCYRRGRYVEFNLVRDRGTLFGLQSGGRTESVLMSLPPVVHWRYDWRPKQGSMEAALYEKYLIPKDWV